MFRSNLHPDEERPPRSRLFWICVLVLIEVAVWTVLSVLGVSETIGTIVAIAVGIAVVWALRDRIWGEDWRERIAAGRERSGPRR